MQIKPDNIFLIGASHKVCQDYTLSGEKDGIYYAIVCDGCSSSKDTDIGARILAIAARQYLDFAHLGYQAYGSMVIRRANDIRTSFGLNISCLDSTLMVTVCEKDRCFTYCYGDGYIIEKSFDDVYLAEHKFESGAPFYLSYWIDKKREEAYKNDFPGQLHINMWTNGIQTASSQFDYNFCIDIKHRIAPGAIILSSDGLDSFSGTNNVPLHAKSLYIPFAAFKNTNGEYLKRRAGKECEILAKNTLKHQDDLGMACLLFEED